MDEVSRGARLTFLGARSVEPSSRRTPASTGFHHDVEETAKRRRTFRSDELRSGVIIKPHRELKLLAQDRLVKTGTVDHADWNYRRIIGRISRQRFELVRALLPHDRAGRLLEIGYGSGVFFPELANAASELVGVDVHEFPDAVATALASAGITATLHTAPAEHLPFEDAAFDIVVCVSALEFVTDLPRVADEMRRVMRPNAIAVVVTPTEHPAFDLALRLLTGKSARADFADRRRGVIATLAQTLELVETKRFPRHPPPGFPAIYTAARFRRPAR